MAAETQNSPFIKHLASSDKETRDQALDSLRAFLGGRLEISELDLLKLWKGLFYCLWMQDKPPLQMSLSLDLASLPTTLQPTVVLPFLRAFWLTMSREWQQIEALRLDKYLFLIRKYVNVSFQHLSKNKWGNRKAIEEYMQIVEETCLNPTDMKVPNGLRYHVLDVWVDELENVEDGWDEKREVLGLMMQPVEKMAKEGKLKVLRNAAKECLEDERLKAWRGEVQGDDDVQDDEEEKEWGGFDD